MKVLEDPVDEALEDVVDEVLKDALEDAVGHYIPQSNILPPGFGPKEKSERNRNGE